MSFTYDLTSSVGKVRLIIRDSAAAIAFFTDEELAAFLTLNGESVRYAAADALETWASNEAMVTKAIKLLDLSTNGPAVAAALRAHAALLRAQAASEDTDTGFDIAELGLAPFGNIEQIENRSVTG
uniref:Uncharacterized protein n=1 Tax=viral metagenome TaxID=1070528 RepID=A0A6H1Z7L3_9ZZZZ